MWYSDLYICAVACIHTHEYPPTHTHTHTDNDIAIQENVLSPTTLGKEQRDDSYVCKHLSPPSVT